MGVQFFFIISGFVIFMTLERCRHLVEFWVRRIARLYPAYIVATLVTFSVMNAIGPVELQSHPRDALIGLMFLTPYVAGAQYVDGSYWSLVTEMQFYFVVGLIYTAARTRFAAVWTAYVCTGAALCLASWLFGMHLLFSLARYVFLVESMPYFSAGILFYHLYKGDTRPVGLFAFATVVSYAVAAPGLWTLQPLLSAAMVVAFVLFVLGRLEWLAVRPLVFLGGISYSFYLLHQYLGVTLIHYLTAFLPDLAAMMCAAAICILLAYALNRAVEVPGKTLVLRWARKNLFPGLGRWLPTFRLAPAARPPLVSLGAPVNIGQQP